MPNHHKVHDLLSAAELAELEAYAREPGRTVDECLAWMTGPERSFNISRGAVANWLRMFLDQERELAIAERTSSAGGLARAFMSAAKDAGGLAIHEAAITQMGQMIFEAGASLSLGGEVTPEDLKDMALALARTMKAKATVEDVRDTLAGRFDAEMSKVTAKREITAEDIAATRKAIFGV